jgi:hypothetical protein
VICVVQYGKAAEIRVTGTGVAYPDLSDGTNILLQLWNDNGNLSYVFLPYYVEKKQGTIPIEGGDKNFQVIIDDQEVTILCDNNFSPKFGDRLQLRSEKSITEYAKGPTSKM